MRSVIVFAVFALALGVLAPNYLTRRDAHPRARPSQQHWRRGRPRPPRARLRARARQSCRATRAAFSGRGAGRWPPDQLHGRYRRVRDRAHRKRCGAARHPSSAARFHRRSPDGEWQRARRAGAPRYGDLIVRDVAAVILPDGALSDNLLGLSFLSRLRRSEYSDGRLVLEQ